MTLKVTSALANAMVATGSLRSLIGASGAEGFLRLFSGPIPATAGEAIDVTSDMIALYTVNDDGTTGLTFEAVATAGVLTKETTEAWESTAAATGVVTYYRWTRSGDNGEGVAGGSDYRIQGTVGVNNFFDLVLSSTSITSAASLVIDNFQIRQPQTQP